MDYSNNMDSDVEEDKLCLHEAKFVTDDTGRIYDMMVLDTLEVDYIVRISFTADSDLTDWTHDSPYVQIKELFPDGRVRGIIYNYNRQLTNKYPLNIGESIWFDVKNIIEIPLNIDNYNYERNKKEQLRFYLTDKILPCTGPLFTVLESDSESDSDSDNESDDSNSDTRSTISDSD